MLKNILNTLPVTLFSGGEGELQSGICLYDYCVSVALQPGGVVVISGEDGYGVAVALEQARAAYLTQTSDGNWLLQFPGEEHRRRWVKNVMQITVQKGGQNQ